MQSESFTPRKTATVNNAGISKINEIPDKYKKTDFDGLKLISNNLTEISAEEMKIYKNIQYLNISKNQIKSLNFLPQLRKLKIFDASFNSLKELNNIEKCPKLERVILNGNKISKISLTNPTETITHLDLSQNSLSKFDFGEQFPNIKKILINANKI